MGQHSGIDIGIGRDAACLAAAGAAALGAKAVLMEKKATGGDRLHSTGERHDETPIL